MTRRLWCTLGARLLAAHGIGVLVVVAAGAPAVAATGWTSAPTDGPAGTAITAGSTSDPTSRCMVGIPVRPDSNELVFYDGARVELTLVRGSSSVRLGTAPVHPGGAWSASLRVPDPTAPGAYDLVARCVVDDARIGGIHSFVFDPRPFTLAATSPSTPTATTPPAQVGDAVAIANPAPARVLAARQDRARAANPPARAEPSDGSAVLPLTGPVRSGALASTGGGTLAVALAGVASLLIGAGALWWGRRRPTRVDS